MDARGSRYEKLKKYIGTETTHHFSTRYLSSLTSKRAAKDKTSETPSIIHCTTSLASDSVAVPYSPIQQTNKQTSHG